MLNLAGAFAGLAERVGAAVGAPFHDAVVITIADAVYDDGGSIIIPGREVERPCRVQIDVSGERIRGTDGYADGDATFIILSATLDGGLDTDANVRVNEGPHAGEWQVSILERDPAAIGYVGRGRKA